MQSWVIVLIAPPGRLASSHVESLRGVAENAGARVTRIEALAEREAFDIHINLEAGQDDSLRTSLAEGLEGAGIDFALLPSEGRRKAALIADMDATIVAEETLDELAAHLGLKDRIAAITARAMAGELDFEAAVKERVGLLAGLSETALAETLEKVTLNDGAQTLVRTMAEHGSHCMLVSGGFRQFTEAVAARCGFHENAGNQLEILDGVLTGRVIAPVRGADAKVESLNQMLAARGLFPDQVIAVGDGANDIPMLRAAGLGVAYHAKPAVRAAVPVSISQSDLTALLYLQGYPRAHFVRAEDAGAG